MNKKLIAGFFSFLLISQGVQAPEASAAPVFISAPTALLLDSGSNQIVYAKTPHLRRAPASTTKLLTAIVALNIMDPDGSVTVTKFSESMQPSKIYLRAGERYRLRDLIYAVLINSANDAAAAIAIAGSGSFQGFSAEMNRVAKSLGCKDSNFVNPSGLPDKRQYSTAYDMALIMREAQRYPLIVQALKTRTTLIKSASGRKIYLKNHNKMLWRDSREILGKTGWTIAARHCFVGQISVAGTKVFVAMLGSHRLWKDLKTLVDFKFGAGYTKSKRTEKIAAREQNKKIQLALKKSGFLKGRVDGVLGASSRKAIRKFQKSRGLKVTGTVTPATWDLLKTYL